VKNLSSGKTATIELTYTVAELAVSGIDTPAEVAQLSVSTVNDQKEWESLNTSATYYDSSGNAMSAGDVTSTLSNVAQVVFATTEATHFSPYALTQASDPTAPATPSGLAISTPSSATALTITWTANTESDLSGYYVYRDTSNSGSFPLVATVSANSYTNTGLSAATTYYYKVGAYDTSSFESTATEAVSAKTLSADSGGIMSGGGGGGAPTPVYTVIPGAASSASSQGATVTQTTTPSATSGQAASQAKVTITITKVLKLGSENKEVRQLQELLAKDTGIYPEGKVTGYFGALTRKAVQNFQKKYGIASSGNENTTGYGLVGPKTLAKIKEVFGTSAAGSGQSVSIDTTASKSRQIQQIQTLINQLLEQVKALQAKKASQ